MAKSFILRVKYAIVTSIRLGTNCWLPVRFCEGGECQRVHTCKYPEKKTCEAVKTEILRMKNRRIQNYRNVVETNKGLSKSIEELEALQKEDSIE